MFENVLVLVAVQAWASKYIQGVGNTRKEKVDVLDILYRKVLTHLCQKIISLADILILMLLGNKVTPDVGE